MAAKQSSPAASTIAARRLAGADLTPQEIDSLAGSVLSQDETRGIAAPVPRRNAMDDTEKLVVLKESNTVNRRLAVGEITTAGEIRAGDRDPEVWRKAGRVGLVDSKAADKAARRARDADGLILADSPGPIPSPEGASSSQAPEPEPPAEPHIKRPSRSR